MMNHKTKTLRGLRGKLLYMEKKILLLSLISDLVSLSLSNQYSHYSSLR